MFGAVHAGLVPARPLSVPSPTYIVGHRLAAKVVSSSVVERPLYKREVASAKPGLTYQRLDCRFVVLPPSSGEMQYT